MARNLFFFNHVLLKVPPQRSPAASFLVVTKSQKSFTFKLPMCPSLRSTHLYCPWAFIVGNSA